MAGNAYNERVSRVENQILRDYGIVGLQGMLMRCSSFSPNLMCCSYSQRYGSCKFLSKLSFNLLPTDPWSYSRVSNTSNRLGKGGHKASA